MQLSKLAVFCLCSPMHFPAHILSLQHKLFRLQGILYGRPTGETDAEQCRVVIVWGADGGGLLAKFCCALLSYLICS